MSGRSHHEVLNGLSEVIRDHRWDDLGRFMHDDVLWEYPQSGERFRGIANVRAQFENYPGLEPGTTSLEEVVGGETYALTPMYTIIAVEGSSDRGTAVTRVRYPDGSRWFAVNLYQLRDGRIAHGRSYFAPDFDPPEWRAPYREAP